MSEPGEGSTSSLQDEFASNAFKYSIEVFLHFVIPIALDPKAFALKICRSRCIGCRVLFETVLATVKLHNKLRFKTDKVHNIWPDRLLAPKLESMVAAVAKRVPKLSLHVGLIASKTARKIVLQ